MRIIRAADCKVMPWKNGGGTTTEIAVSPKGASLSDFDWRISMAHVERTGPFSSFPGIDRTLSVLTGNGIRLDFDDGETVSLDQASAPFAFAAERAVTCELVDGPISDLNVMSRRGVHKHDVRRLAGPVSQRLEAKDSVTVLIVSRGVWSATSRATTETLSARDSIILHPDDTVEINSVSDCEMFEIRFL